MTEYSNYARTRNGLVVVRYSTRDEWGKRGWPPRLAHGFAEYVRALADQALREDPRVIALAAVLNDGPGSETIEETALRLHTAGYRRQRYP